MLSYLRARVRFKQSYIERKKAPVDQIRKLNLQRGKQSVLLREERKKEFSCLEKNLYFFSCTPLSLIHACNSDNELVKKSYDTWLLFTLSIFTTQGFSSIKFCPRFVFIPDKIARPKENIRNLRKSRRI